MAIWVKTDGSFEEVSIKGDREDSQLSILQNMVSGYVETMSIYPVHVVTSEGKDYGVFDTMIVNEEGLIHQLPVNEFATKMVNPPSVPITPIVGDVVLCNLSDLR
jgi:hypothetical protein